MALRRLGYSYLIVGLTASALEDDVADYLKAGADVVLSKPLKITHLDMLLKHIHENGTTSEPTKKLVISCGKFIWVDRT